MSIPSQSIQSLHEKINTLCQKVHDNSMSSPVPPQSPRLGMGMRPNALPVADLTPRGTPTRQRRLVLPVASYSPREPNAEMERKLQEIVKLTGILEINNTKYPCDIKELEHIGELGSGTCGLVVKMLHKPSQTVIAVKQMRRSGNSEENKRIIMDLDVVLKSHDCPFIVKCLGSFITESDVWICMELMATCFDKLLKRHHIRIPEDILGKVTCATVKALDYLKEKHGVIHRDVKPSNILLDEKGNVKLCDFGISGRLVDSKAQTASAGCAAYLAPERIAPTNPNKPDYDIRADVWSLGITLVELATGVFPYRQCSSDFQVLAEIVTKEPPTLPQDQHFSPEFRSFVTSCLTKNYRDRPKYKKLLEHAFIKRAEASTVDVAAWFARTVPGASPARRSPTSRRLAPVHSRCATENFRWSHHLATRPPDIPNSASSKHENQPIVSSQNNVFWQARSTYIPATSNEVRTSYVSAVSQLQSVRSSFLSSNNHENGSSYIAPTNNYIPISSQVTSKYVTTSGNDVRSNCVKSRLTSPPLCGIGTLQDKTNHNSEVGSLSNYGESLMNRTNEVSSNVSAIPIQTSQTSGAFHRFWSENSRPPTSHNLSSYPNHNSSVGRGPELCRAVLRSQSPVSHIVYSSVSPPVSRAVFSYRHATAGASDSSFQPSTYSSQSSHISVPEPNHSSKGEEKKRYSSYLKFHFGGVKDDRERGNLPPVARSAGHVSPGLPSSHSPEPPPRFGRLGQRHDDDSPLPQRRMFFDPIQRLEGSPSLSRRYITPSPPQPPPRRLAESSSVPGSPQHDRVERYRARLHYTPVPQRRVFDAGPQF